MLAARGLVLPTLALAALALGGCADEEILHGLAEAQANEVLVALDEGGVAGRKRRDEGADPAWTVAVHAGEAVRAQRILADRELPRPRAPGFGEVFGKGGMVPTPTEEHALYLHALAGELSRSIEAIDGVVEARVHLGLPQSDPLRVGDLRPPRAAVLVKCRPVACAGVRALEGGIRSLVAGAADGLDSTSVSVVVAPGPESHAPSRPPSPVRSPLLLGVAAAAALAAAGLAAAAVLRAHRARGAAA
jgi:type III secretion protein J